MEPFPSEEHALIRRTVREFAEREVKPGARARDEEHRFPRDLLPKMAELGLLGMPFPTDYGGAGTDYVSYLIAEEEISRADASLGVIMSVNNSLTGWPLFTYGNEEQRKKWLPAMLSGKRLGAFGLSEPGAGSDPAAMKTRAEKRGDGYVLNGQKVFITNGGEAEIYLVFAVTDPAAKHRGVSAFVVEKGTKGFTIGKPEEKMGIRASTTVQLFFENVHLPKENLLGTEGQGFKIAMSTLDGGRLGIAAQAVGIASAALEDALAYAKERDAFGVKIGSFQALQWMLADSAMEIEAARLMMYRAARLKEQGKPYAPEAAAAKLFASEMANRVVNKAVQVFGGSGYIREYPVERYMRDQKITEIYEGTSEIMRLIVSGAELGIR